MFVEISQGNICTRNQLRMDNLLHGGAIFKLIRQRSYTLWLWVVRKHHPMQLGQGVLTA